MSTTDPDSTYATKGGTPARLGYYDNYLVDNHSCVIVGVQATAARMSQETVAAQDMLTRFTQWQGREPESVAADTTYGNGEFLQWLADRSITPYMRTRDSIHRKRSPFFGPERFTYEPENNRYICPAGQPLNYGGWVHRNQRLQLHRDTQKVWSVLAPTTMHQCCLPRPYHPPERTSPTTCAGVAQHARVRQSTAAKKEGGSLVRGTEESDRIAALASAETQIRAGTVLPGSGGPEHQATGALPESADYTYYGSRLLVEVEEKTRDCRDNRGGEFFRSRTFSTPTPVYVNYLLSAGTGFGVLVDSQELRKDRTTPGSREDATVLQRTAFPWDSICQEEKI